MLALVLTGCQLAPIKTTLGIESPSGLGINYTSEKDVIYRKSVTRDDGNTETIEFSALASAAAHADAERQRAQAEANARNAEIALKALQMIPGVDDVEISE